ncbi:MAG: helix-turn-helix domain-containing protein [Syntrophales bacterium]
MTTENDITQLSDLFFTDNHGKVYRVLLDKLERPLISRVLVLTGGNQLKAASVLGINRNTLRAKIKRLGINV